MNERNVGKQRVSLSMTQSAAMPLTTITAYETSFEPMGIAQDERPDRNPFPNQPG
ncbi:MAG: hypothetical protein NPIRA06_29050 [Nitrospirales bacterium]|nr:MAG: hypothetical protein NPIRA06_29050 [Nitrospirales bacterium]